MSFGNKDSVEEIIESIKEVFKENFGINEPIEYFLHGHCYYFALILKNIIPESIMYNDIGHVIINIEELFYDVTGCLGRGENNLTAKGLTGFKFNETTDANISEIAKKYLKYRGTFVESTKNRLSQLKYPPDKEKEILEKCQIAIEAIKNRKTLPNGSKIKGDFNNLEILVLKRNGNIVFRNNKGNLERFAKSGNTIDIENIKEDLALQAGIYEKGMSEGIEKGYLKGNSKSVIDLGELSEKTKTLNITRINGINDGEICALSVYPKNVNKNLAKVCFAVLPQKLTNKNSESYIEFSIEELTKILKSNTKMEFEGSIKEVLANPEILKSLSDLSSSLNEQYRIQNQPKSENGKEI